METWNTAYEKLVRISKKNLDWLKKNKGQKSAAGLLDEIINKEKKRSITAGKE